MAISNFTIPYPDFKLNDTIQPDEFDDNNNRIVNKVNEIITTFNALVVDVDALEASSAAGDATLQTNLNNAVTALQAADTAIRAEFAAADTAVRNYFTGATSGSSGAERVGSAPISGVTGSTVWAQLSSLKSMIDAIVGGSIPDGTITYAKLSPAPDSEPTAGRIALRDSAGNLKVWFPTDARHAANKLYVDGKLYTLASSVSLDTLLTPGFYYVTTPTNAPIASSYYYVTVMSSDVSTYILQTAYINTTADMYVRRRSAGTWGAWYKVNPSVGTTAPTSPVLNEIWIDTST